MMRKICVVYSNQNLERDRWIFDFFRENKTKYDLVFIDKSTEPDLQYDLSWAEVSHISNPTQELNFFKNNKIDVLFDLTGYQAGHTLVSSRRAGIQIRIVYFGAMSLSGLSKRSATRQISKHATKILGGSENVLKEVFPFYHRYFPVFRLAEFTASTQATAHDVIKAELEAPLRTEGLKLENPVIRWVWTWVKKYDHKHYWRMRFVVVTPNNNTSKVKKLWYLFRLKRMDAFHNSSFGTGLNAGAHFETPPYLPHGPNGIIVGHDCFVGREVTIYQQVTIMHGNVRIGNNVLLGAGCKILPNVTIGDNVKVGANCVVIEDIPAGATVVLPKPRIILTNE